MPVEIKELVVRTTIDNRVEASIQQSTTPDEYLAELIPKLKEEIINECFSQIMDQLRTHHDR